MAPVDGDRNPVGEDRASKVAEMLLDDVGAGDSFDLTGQFDLDREGSTDVHGQVVVLVDLQIFEIIVWVSLLHCLVGVDDLLALICEQLSSPLQRLSQLVVEAALERLRDPTRRPLDLDCAGDLSTEERTGNVQLDRVVVAGVLHTSSRKSVGVCRVYG